MTLINCQKGQVNASTTALQFSEDAEIKTSLSQVLGHLLSCPGQPLMCQVESMSRLCTPVAFAVFNLIYWPLVLYN